MNPFNRPLSHFDPVDFPDFNRDSWNREARESARKYNLTHRLPRNYWKFRDFEKQVAPLPDGTKVPKKGKMEGSRNNLFPNRADADHARGFTGTTNASFFLTSSSIQPVPGA